MGRMIVNHEWEDAAGAYVGVFLGHSPGRIKEMYEKPRRRKDGIFIPNFTRFSPLCTGESQMKTLNITIKFLMKTLNIVIAFNGNI